MTLLTTHNDGEYLETFQWARTQIIDMGDDVVVVLLASSLHRICSWKKCRTLTVSRADKTSSCERKVDVKRYLMTLRTSPTQHSLYRNTPSITHHPSHSSHHWHWHITRGGTEAQKHWYNNATASTPLVCLLFQLSTH